MNKIVLCSLLGYFVGPSEASRILGAVFTPSYSHQLVFQPIWRELSLRGHQVTVLTTDPMKDPSLKNLTEIDLSMSYEIMRSHNTDELLSTTKESAVGRVKKYIAALHHVADAQLSHPEVQKVIHEEKFDLLIVEAIFPTHMAMAWWFNVPFIGMISLDAPSRIHDAVGNPIHPALYPDYDLPFDKDLTFWERVVSTYFHWGMTLFNAYRLHPGADLTIKKHFGSNAPSITEIQNNMSMLFINVNPILQNVRPLGPSTVTIGSGIHAQDYKPLPLDIQEFLDKSIKGFIYCSLGTNVKSASLQDNVKAAMLHAFSELPYNILWKFEDQDIPGRPKNVKIVQWVPQTSVLAHHNIKAFITQCGLQSIEEAIFHHVPMIGMPFYGDQGKNAKIIESKLLGLKLSPNELDKQKLVNSVVEVTSNNLYKDNLKMIANLYNDEPMSGLQKAVWWTEYVLRHNGAHHLKSHRIHLPLYQYYSIDVISFTLGTIIAIISVLTFMIKLLFRLCRTAINKSKRE